jgi:hypothetical protein
MSSMGVGYPIQARFVRAMASRWIASSAGVKAEITGSIELFGFSSSQSRMDPIAIVAPASFG